MAIIQHTKDDNVKYAYLNIFPDQFKTEKYKEKDTYVKQTLDYFSNRAFAEYTKNRQGFVKNYDLVKGILRSEDFYEDENVKSFADMLEGNLDLPSYVKHYSILTTPINELVGELTKRPDTYKIKAFDDDSKAEELQFKTELLQQFVVEKAKETIKAKAALKGEKIEGEDLEQMTMEQVQDEIDAYTSVAEKWGNHTLTALKAEFNVKEMSEDSFRDLLIASRQFYHIYEDNSKTGFNAEVLNPKNVWYLTTPDRKYVTDVSGRNRGAYASGKVEVMELSEIIESCPELTKAEIDHLRSGLEDYGLINTRESNLGKSQSIGGQNTVNYDTYDPLVLQHRMMLESDMKENNDGLQDFLGLTSNVSSFGYKYVVCTSYWISKKKIGKLTFLGDMEEEQTILVDETYKSGDHPNQISLEWGWVNQMYWGKKIGPDIYHMGPYKLLPYLPIIGMTHELKNTEARSLVDMMKPFQVIYNVCMNQMFELLKKEKGNVAVVNIRRIPRVKDGDGQDDIDIWEMEAAERGIMFDDDSPENTKAPVSNQSVIRNVDLTRSSEIQTRYNLAVQMKNECWELIGMSKQRMGSVAASETATGTNTAVQQSYTQTEPIFVAHEYVIGQFYQALVDAAQYVESSNEKSTVSYVTNEGESAFISVNGHELSLRELKVFMTNRPEDTRLFNEIRQLSQSILQNGGSAHDVIELYSDQSIRELRRKFKKIKEEAQAQIQQAQELEQQKIQQAQQAHQSQLEQNLQIQQVDMENDNYQKELDRIHEKEVAMIKAMGFGQVEGEDTNANNVPDLFESQKLGVERDKVTKEHQLKLADIKSKFQIENRKLDVALKNQDNDLAIAKQNAKGRNNKKS
jgi:hypothetical protein